MEEKKLIAVGWVVRDKNGRPYIVMIKFPIPDFKDFQQVPIDFRQPGKVEIPIRAECKGR